ncbi:hypothetical protein IE077_003918 [Cardiosporidium cionae]|uniref:CP-type G domain-containing protein n=1 Tax=Cardiosporidium cionae TaxID=476202 RepID=A0ABQ7JEC8_9APIC|nr:hypothetical protein IE077_003918 [Cardiosporidium cionae]|eukprot:KAF8822367.1 hypothetical protein IE077_003918 [Cardiosporidium cionae]
MCRGKSSLLSSSGLGRSIRNAKTQMVSTQRAPPPVKGIGLPQHAELFSVSSKKMESLFSVVEESTQLDEYLATTLAAQREFSALRGILHLPSAKPISRTAANTSKLSTIVPIPRRPKFRCSVLHPTAQIECPSTSLIDPDPAFEKSKECADEVKCSLLQSTASVVEGTNSPFPDSCGFPANASEVRSTHNNDSFSRREKSPITVNSIDLFSSEESTRRICDDSISNIEEQNEKSLHVAVPKLTFNQDDQFKRSPVTYIDDLSAESSRILPGGAFSSGIFIDESGGKSKILSKDELESMELESFLEWRRELAKLEECQDVAVTPYEKNLEIWKQLWRVVERSSIILQILDGRNPLLFRSIDLEKYANEVDPLKQSIIVINKADLLTRSQRKQWLEFFRKQGKEVLFFSAIRELYIQGAIHVTQSSELPQESAEFRTSFSGITLGYGNLHPEEADDSPSDVLTCEALIHFLQEKKRTYVSCDHNPAHLPRREFIVGVVGYPNVGKSSLINSLFGRKKVSVSRQPGKTKHFQTLSMPDYGITLCDCPGLVFPSVVQTKHHLLVNGIISIEHFRGDYLPAVQLICDWIPEQLCLHYKIMMDQLSHAKKVGKFHLDASTFLSCLAENRHFFSGGRGGLFDLFRAAAMITRDFCCGKILYCAPPPLDGAALPFDEEVIMDAHAPPLSINRNIETAKEAEVTSSLPLSQLEESPVDEDDINLAEFLHPSSANQRDQTSGKHMTKRGRRHIQKQFLKGNTVSVDTFGGYLV